MSFGRLIACVGALGVVIPLLAPDDVKQLFRGTTTRPCDAAFAAVMVMVGLALHLPAPDF